MKAMSKQQLADAAGISVDTLRKWLTPHKKKLETLGMTQKMRVIPPSVVAFIIETFCIDV